MSEVIFWPMVTIGGLGYCLIAVLYARGVFRKLLVYDPGYRWPVLQNEAVFLSCLAGLVWPLIHLALIAVVLPCRLLFWVVTKNNTQGQEVDGSEEVKNNDKEN